LPHKTRVAEDSRAIIAGKGVVRDRCIGCVSFLKVWWGEFAGSFEVRKDPVECVTLVADHVRPELIRTLGSTVVAYGVEGGAATQCFPLRIVDAPVSGRRLGRGKEVPVHERVARVVLCGSQYGHHEAIIRNYGLVSVVLFVDATGLDDREGCGF
jgi:hypothetical protein